MKTLYEITRTLSVKNSNSTIPVRDNEETITREMDQRARWRNTSKTRSTAPHHRSYQTYHQHTSYLTSILYFNTNSPTKTEIIKATKSLKPDKAAGPIGIPPEALEADIQTFTCRTCCTLS
jgi:hypothetical protein